MLFDRASSRRRQKLGIDQAFMQGFRITAGCLRGCGDRPASQKWEVLSVQSRTSVAARTGTTDVTNGRTPPITKAAALKNFEIVFLRILALSRFQN
jgi:hypothetical protein